MDDRPRLAEAFRQLRAGEGPLWITWGSRRLLLASPSPVWIDKGIGKAVIATKRGYRMVEFIGLNTDELWWEANGKAKHRPFRVKDDYFNPVDLKRIRAVILEDHPR